MVQLGREPLGRVLRGHEHQHALPAVVLDQLAQQLGAAARVDRDGALQHHGLGLRRGGHVHALRVTQQAARERFHGGREGGREKQVLSLRGQQGEHAVQLVRKTQVEQTVGLVQHQQLHRREPQCVVLHQVEQAPGRGDHHVGAAAQRHELRVDGHATKCHRDARAGGQVLRQAAQHLAHLGGQFARGHQHEGAHAPRCVHGPALQALQQRQGEGRGFARSGLGRGEQIGAAQHGGDGFQLDGGGRGEAEFGGGLGEGGGKPEGDEWHGGSSLTVGPRGAAPRYDAGP